MGGVAEIDRGCPSEPILLTTTHPDPSSLQTIQQEWLHDGGEDGCLSKAKFTQVEYLPSFVVDSVWLIIFEKSPRLQYPRRSVSPRTSTSIPSLTHSQSIFELADQWVDSINAVDYEDFIYHLLWEIASEWCVQDQISSLLLFPCYYCEDGCASERVDR